MSYIRFDSCALFRQLQLLRNCNGQLKLCNERAAAAGTSSFAFNNQSAQPSELSNLPQKLGCSVECSGRRKNEYTRIDKRSRDLPARFSANQKRRCIISRILNFSPCPLCLSIFPQSPRTYLSSSLMHLRRCFSLEILFLAYFWKISAKVIRAFALDAN